MSEEFINPVFNVFPESVDDSSIHQYEYVRYATTDGLEITNFSGPIYKLVTKSLDSYLLPQKGYLDLVFRISEDSAGTLTTDRTALHANVMALFSKISYFINSVPIEEVEYPVLTTTIRNLLEYSQDYEDKQGPAQWHYLDDAGTDFANTLPVVSRIQDAGNLAKRVRVLIPLNRMFPFMDSYGSCMRGLEHRFEFIKEERPAYFMWGPATNAADRVIFDQMSVWIPKLIPSPSAEKAFLTAIKNNNSAMVNYESWNGYRQPQQANNALLVWQIGATTKKPKYVFCAFQKGERLNLRGKAAPDQKDVNPGVFDNLEVTQIELKCNSKRFPLERYRLDFTAPTAAKADEYSRAYKDFLRIMDKDNEYDNGSLVSYESYNSTYSIFAFDLSNDHSLFENTQTNYIEVEATFKNAPAAQYYSNAVIVWDREIKLASDGESISLIRG